MGFFDLNIPYTNPSPSDQSTRAKLVTKALELGYSGVAYNRTIKGVMSDHDRCSIPLLTLPSLLKHSPHLLASVNFHRDLLAVPRTSPFRQYTRLTVCADSNAQTQALNSGNPVLKSYDLVAVKPMNQTAFDQACEKLEVDIIAIDFSEKLPFRLKQQMVKAAIERGVYFEITYASLIADVQARRQMISNAKLLVDWTRGRNLIISSAAPTANEFRGPYDVANLMSLLGLSMERAKAAISRNCRTLISNAVRKKHFYKEAIRVEVRSSGQETDTNKPWSSDLFKWDPISSGEGDLQLDDLAKSFTTTGNKVSKTVKGIDFASVIDSMPSLGFQVKDLISGADVVVSQSMDTGKNIVSAPGVIEQSVAPDGVVVPQSMDTGKNIVSAPEVIDQPVATDRVVVPQSMDTGTNVVSAAEVIEQSVVPEHPDRLYFPQPGQTCDTNKPIFDVAGIKAPTLNTEAEAKNTDGADGNLDLTTTEINDLQSQRCVTNYELNVVPPNDNLTFQTLDIGLDAACNADSKVEVSTNYEDTDIPAPHTEEAKGVKSSNAQCDPIDETFTVVDIKSKEEKSLALNSSLHKNISETAKLRETGDDAVILANQVPVLESNDEMIAIDDYSVANHGSPDVKMEEQKHGEADTEMNYPPLDQSVSGKSRAKRKTPHQATLFPLKRLLHPVSFKKARKSKSKIRMP